jgi:hypothetical protein
MGHITLEDIEDNLSKPKRADLPNNTPTNTPTKKEALKAGSYEALRALLLLSFRRQDTLPFTIDFTSQPFLHHP